MWLVLLYKVLLLLIICIVYSSPNFAYNFTSCPKHEVIKNQLHMEILKEIEIPADHKWLDLSAYNSDIEINKYEGASISIKIYGNVDELNNIELSNKETEDKLFISLKEKKKLRNSSLIMKLLLPGTVTDIAITSSNGDVTVSDIYLDSFDCKLDNGNLEVENVEAKKFTGYSQNGDVIVCINDFINASGISGNGDVKFKIPKTKEVKVTVQSDNGDTKVIGITSNSQSVNTIDCRSENGDVIVKGL